MLKKLALAAALATAAGNVSAATITAIPGIVGETLVNKSAAADLTGIGFFQNSPLLVTASGGTPGSFVSPFGPSDNTTDYFAVGDATNPDFASTANSLTPASLSLDSLTQAVSFFWGTPSATDFVTLMRDGTQIATFFGSDVSPTGAGVFAIITADIVNERFDTILFGTQPGSGANSFEFAGIGTVDASTTQVPLPAGFGLLLTALGAAGLMRRRQRAA